MAKKRQNSRKENRMEFLPHHHEQSDKLQHIQEEIVKAEQRKTEIQAQIRELQKTKEALERQNAELVATVKEREEKSRAHHGRIMPTLEEILSKVKAL